jgi:GTPase SAR1 family protein
MTTTTESNFSFGSDRQKIFKFDRFLRKLSEFSLKVELKELLPALDRVLQRLETGTFSIAILGEVQTGKTTLTNVLLGANILPVNSLAISTLNHINYSLNPSVKLFFQDGQNQNITVEDLISRNENLKDKVEDEVETIAQIDIEYPFRYGQNDVEIIDTQGIDSYGNVNPSTASILPNIDLAIFVLSVESALSNSEKNFLEKQLLARDLGKVIFVINGSDRINDREEANNLIKIVKEKLQQQVIKNIKTKFTIHSAEYITCLGKIGQLKVFCISAADALQAKLDGNNELLNKSRSIELEKNLERLLDREKGLITLQIAVNSTLLAATTILKEIKRQQSLLESQERELQAIYEEPLQDLKASQQNRREKVHKLRHLQELESLQKEILDLRAKWEREKTSLEIERDRFAEMLRETENILRESRAEALQILHFMGFICPQCGKMNQSKANFCMACGLELLN